MPRNTVPARIVPPSVAIGTTRDAFSTLSAGTVADSMPRNAQKHKAAAVAMLPLVNATGGCTTGCVPPSHSTAASTITANSGTTLITAVIRLTSPALRTPMMLTAVSSHTQPTASTAGSPGTCPITGITSDRLLTTATAIAPLPAHNRIQ